MTTESTEAKTENQSPDASVAVQPVVMCACHPSHCEHGDTCWCEPAVELLDNGDKLIIHNKGH